MSRCHRSTLVAVALLVAGACAESPPVADPFLPGDGTTVLMDFAAEGFWATPFPGDHRLNADGRVDLGGFPNPDDITFVADTLALLDGKAEGFGTTSAVHMPMSATVDAASLPELSGSMAADASVFVVDLETEGLSAGRRYPVQVAFHPDAGPFGTANLLSVLPLQGVPLEPGRRYAAVVTREVLDHLGKPLARSQAMADLLNGKIPEGLTCARSATLVHAVARLKALGVDVERVAGLSAFTAWRPGAGLDAVVAHMKAQPLPTPVTAIYKTDEFPTYCVYETRVQMPVYQQGEPPYNGGGGGLRFDGEGKPVLVRQETARLVLTVPRTPMPATGWPIVVFVRTGGGGDRPLVDRGPRGADGKAIEAGQGPAVHFAAAGWAGASIDGPLGGLRNPTGGDEQFLIFNILNPAAMRDNLRQSAAELSLLPAMLADLRIDLSTCPEVGLQRAKGHFNVSRIALMGHSMGATIAPLALAAQPAYKAAILSGAGGSWIENILFKQSPLKVRPLAEAMLGYPKKGLSLHRHDPFLNLMQWGGEPADPPVYGPQLIHGASAQGGRHVLMLQGIVDTYIMPTIANATSLSLGLDLAGPALDGKHPALTEFTPLASLLPLVGRGATSLPAKGNIEGSDASYTGVVIQHAQDDIEDGHEVVFQTEAPMRQYRCFLESLAASGLPRVPAAGPVDAPCGAAP